MADIVISEFMDEDVVTRALAGRDVLFDKTLVDRTGDLHAALADARALIVRNRTQVRGALLEAAPMLKVVGRLGVGLDNIDLEACKARGIAVKPASGANDLAVAEYVITTALMMLRGAYGASGSVIAGDWPRMALIGREASGQRIGFIGYGAIAREAAKRAAALGMIAQAYDPFVAADDPAWTGAERIGALEDLFATSDVISLHTPLTDDTRHLVNAQRLALTRPGTVIINAARGGVVDETALIAALKSGHLGGAALDVFEREPVDGPAGAAFDGVPNLILTPHIAGVTAQSNVRVSAVTLQNVLAVLDA